MKNDQNIKPVLIIDDEISILKLMERILSRNGYPVDTAQSGEEGIQKIDQNDYSLVLTDIKMSGISGNQVSSYLKNDIKKTTPVIGMSGTPWLLDEKKFDAVLVKPHSMHELLDLLEQYIHK